MPQIINSRCVLAVRDLAASTQFYMDVLGFQRDFGDGADGWSFLSRNGFRLMLGECRDATPAGELGDHSWFVHLIVDDVDRLHDEVASRVQRSCRSRKPDPGGSASLSSARPTDIASSSASR